MKPRRRAAATYALSAAAIGLIALAAAAMPRFRPVPQPPPPAATPPPAPPAPPQIAAQPEPPRPEPPVVEVVFALDTTGSMEGLIDGAKRKIWSLVNFIASGQPQPKVRIGLVGYRDVGDAYVTRFYDLSDDMDEVFQHLSRFRADGGGDTPEHVAKALHDAVERTHWSSGQNVAKIVYIVGDAPPHTDYDDGYNFKAIARKAAQKGIHVNTILCGGDDEAEQAFRVVARLGSGQYASIEQSGGVADVRTPYDRKLADLNARLSSTVIGFGKHGGEAMAKASASAAAPAPLAADRASFAARSGRAVFAEGDLLEAAAGKGGVNALKAEDLPATVANMEPAAREQFVAEKQKERTKMMEEIRSLSAQRDGFLKDEAKKAKRADGFDDKVRKSIVEGTQGVVTY